MRRGFGPSLVKKVVLAAMLLAAFNVTVRAAVLRDVPSMSTSITQDQGDHPLGSGDGRIHVIPALSAPSVKNGGTLTIQAVVKTVAGVAKVEAEIEGVTRLELKPAGGMPSNAPYRSYHALEPGMPPNGSATLYQAEWTARGLKEKVYPITLHVTDLAGHVFEDRSLSFSDPAAGNSTPGSTNYPCGTLPRRVGALTLKAQESWLQSAVIDSAGGYAYFSTTNSPGVVVKIRLSDFTRVGTLTLNEGEDNPAAAVIDPAGGYAYFGTYTAPGKVVKIRLSDFTRVGALTLQGGEDNLECAVIDTAAGFAYFGTDTTPGSIVKVRLADFTCAGALTLNAGEDRLRCAAIDAAGGYAYWGAMGSSGNPGKLVKMRLADFTRVGALTLNDNVGSAALDPAGGYLYLGTSAYSDAVIKVRLADFTRVATLQLNTNVMSFTSALMDPDGAFAYFGATNGVVAKVRLADFTHQATFTLNDDLQDFWGAVIDPATGNAYFALNDRYMALPGRVVRLHLSDMSCTGELTLDPGEDCLAYAVMDPSGQYAYFGASKTGTIPPTASGKVVKVRLADFTRVDALTLAPGEGQVTCAAMDPAGSYACFGTFSHDYSNAGNLVKIRLADLTRVATLPLDPGEYYAGCALIDPAGQFAYLGISRDTQPGRVAKIRLSDFTRVGTLTLNAGESEPACGFVDPAGAYACFGTMTVPGRVVKIRLSDFTHAGALTLPTGENYLQSVAADPSGQFAYFGTNPYTGSFPIDTAQVIKVRLSDLTRVGALTLNQGENNLYCAVIDPAGEYAYFGGGGITGMMVKVRLADFSRIGVLTPADWERSYLSAVIDPAGNFAYFGSFDAPGHVVKVALNFKNALRANRISLGEEGKVKDVRFYSHAAKGDLRLALYNDATTKTLLWQSDPTSNTAANGWLTVPVAAGHPSALSLDPGKYWLAWQSDSAAAVASYALGTAGEGLVADQSFGAFPGRLGLDEVTTTTEKWSAYLTYDLQTPAPPANPGATGIGATHISWTWSDESSDETGFKVWADPGLTTPTTLRTTTAANATSWTMTGLTPNTAYTFRVASANASGDSSGTVNTTIFTLASVPVIGGNVSCDHASGPLHPNGTAFGFFNPAGFGTGTHGGSPLKVSKFRYAWDAAPTHAFAGNEPQWSSGVLPLTPTATGRWYLHLQSINAAGVAGATLDYGPFGYDRDVPGALSNTPTTTTWVTNGPVHAIAHTSSTIYLGGDFDYFGPYIGGGVPLSTATGKSPVGYPKVNGVVWACAPDGMGGWYISGAFSQVGTLARSCLAHILADGRVDAAWHPDIQIDYNTYIRTLVVSGGTIYIGGHFMAVNGQPRNGLAALDAATGTVKAWNPMAESFYGVPSYIYALAVSGGTVYVAGDFYHIGGQNRRYLAALDATSGVATAWYPDPDDAVDVLAVSGGTVFAAGNFHKIGGQTRYYFAALDAVSGAATAWNLNVSSVSALVVSGRTLYIGGEFYYCGDQSRRSIAAVDIPTGVVTDWNPSADGNYPEVKAMAVSGRTVYVGGWFDSIGGQARPGLAALDISTGKATAWYPEVGLDICALACAGQTVYVGGDLNSTSGLACRNLAAIDIASGAVKAWHPEADSRVCALAVADGKVYAGGEFNQIDGQGRYHLAALDADSGGVTAWNPSASYGGVHALAVSGGIVYAGGNFWSINEQDRHHVAALDAASGAVLPWNPDVMGYDGVEALAVAGKTVFIGGNFYEVNGQPRRNLAAVDAASGAVLPWNPGVANGWEVSDLAVSGGKVFIGGDFTSIGGLTRNHIAALDASSGVLLPWNPNANASVWALAVAGETVYVQGDFTSIGGKERNCLAALDATSATATLWNPNATGVYYRAWEALDVAGGKVYAGGSFTEMGGWPQPYFAEFAPLTRPSAPWAPYAIDVELDRLTWNWTGAATNEDGFKIYAGPGSAAPAALTSTTQANVELFTMCGLTPNTQYAFQVAATNAAGDSAKSKGYTTFTLAAAPVSGRNIAASQATGVAQPVGTTFVFSNPAGFGAGTHGGGAWKVSGFRCVWNQNATYAFSGKEPLWYAGTLNRTAASPGRYYLHLQSTNAAGVANPATLDFGPLVVGDPPLITTKPAGRTVNPGATVSVSVKATGTAPLVYQWLKNGAALADGGRIAGVKTASLSLGNAAWSDCGLYACRVTNAVGSTLSSAARLIVNPTLTITSAHGSPLPAVGSTVYTSGTLLTARVPAATVYDPADAAGTTRWVCTGWTATGSAPASGTGSSVNFKLTQPTTLTWLWKTQYKLTATASPSSRGSVKLADGVTAANGTWHDAGGTVQLRAMPNSGNRFAFWWGALSNRSNPASLLMTQPKSIVARFDTQSNGAQDWLVYP